MCALEPGCWCRCGVLLVATQKYLLLPGAYAGVILLFIGKSDIFAAQGYIFFLPPLISVFLNIAPRRWQYRGVSFFNHQKSGLFPDFFQSTSPPALVALLQPAGTCRLPRSLRGFRTRTLVPNPPSWLGPNSVPLNPMVNDHYPY